MPNLFSGYLPKVINPISAFIIQILLLFGEVAFTSDKKNPDELSKQASTEGEFALSFPVVGIGASAGGLDPIRKLLEDLPIDTGMAFVVIQHLAQGQESLLPEILSRSTEMKVISVKDGMTVESNQVYVITPGTTMTLKNGCLKLVPKGAALKPINDFMISLAFERKAQAIGVVLSGTGNDGTEGLKAIKAEGGITFVQDPETANTLICLETPSLPKLHILFFPPKKWRRNLLESPRIRNLPRFKRTLQNTLTPKLI